ncbi:hypothetical protein ACH4PU_36000 [Streptomyces sp. NPDC021100]|uniref:terpene synthase family protein n=1 Tax=Streptomyces sp. NPDC021100 TaxID=3365114 RepID=UPI0037B65F98
MPQGVEFDIPFPPALNPNLERARPGHMAWLREQGLIRTTHEAELYLFMQISEATAYTYNRADPDELRLALDMVGWTALFNDQFDGPTGKQPERTRAVCQELVQLTRRPPGAGEPKTAATRAWVDVWRRSCHRMSEAWRERAAANWREYIASHTDETDNRTTSSRPSAEEYPRLRRATVGMGPYLDLTERVYHAELPAQLDQHPALNRMRTLATDVVWLIDDVHSVEREQARGDVHNFVLLLERDRSRPEAIGSIQARVAQATAEFRQLETRSKALPDELGLTGSQAQALTCYLASMRDFMSGTYQWLRTSPRFRPAGVIPPERPGHIADILADFP